MINNSTETTEKYEVVVGLEVHVQLSTASKIFSTDSAAFGAGPNQHVSPVSLGHPGTLPYLNKQVVIDAVKMGLACNCEINPFNSFARKNYFYADLPKGYQITQDQQPVCLGGGVKVQLNSGVSKVIALHHIHMEEDAGKSMHDQHHADSFIDLNRAGVPLIEIVTEPDMHSGVEAGQFISEVRKLVRYLDICDGNMEEGSIRCDANISVRLRGDTHFGNRCEVKNLNSIRNVQRAIEHEFQRQVYIIENGGFIDQNTLNFDAETGETTVLRSKEMANDYRYFPEPDLPPLVLTKEFLDDIRGGLPPLPSALYDHYINALGLTPYHASCITAEKEVTLYFNRLIKCTANYKAAANWITGPVKALENDNGAGAFYLKFEPKRLAELIELIDSGRVNNSVATQRLFPAMLKDSSKSAEVLATELNLFISTTNSDVDRFVQEVIAKYPDKVVEYKKGKKGVLQLFMGEIMKNAKGRIDPKTTNQMLINELESM